MVVSCQALKRRRPLALKVSLPTPMIPEQKDECKITKEFLMKITQIIVRHRAAAVTTTKDQSSNHLRDHHHRNLTSRSRTKSDEKSSINYCDKYHARTLSDPGSNLGAGSSSSHNMVTTPLQIDIFSLSKTYLLERWVLTFER